MVAHDILGDIFLAKVLTLKSINVNRNSKTMVYSTAKIGGNVFSYFPNIEHFQGAHFSLPEFNRTKTARAGQEGGGGGWDSREF